MAAQNAGRAAFERQFSVALSTYVIPGRMLTKEQALALQVLDVRLDALREILDEQIARKLA